MDFPSGLIISNVKIKHNIPTLFNRALNKKATANDRGIHIIEGSFDVTISSDADKRAIEAFLLRLRGRANPFFLRLGNRFTSASPVSGAKVLGSHTAGDDILRLQTITGNITNGDLFTINNSNKVYMALENISTGSGFLDIYPPLRKDTSSETPVNFTDVAIQARLTSDVQEISYNEGGLIHVLTFNWEEALD